MQNFRIHNIDDPWDEPEADTRPRLTDSLGEHIRFLNRKINGRRLLIAMDDGDHTVIPISYTRQQTA